MTASEWLLTAAKRSTPLNLLPAVPSKTGNYSNHDIFGENNFIRKDYRFNADRTEVGSNWLTKYLGVQVFGIGVS